MSIVWIKTTSNSHKYKVAPYNGKYYVSVYRGGLLGGSYYDIGSAKTFDDGLAIARSHARSNYGSVVRVSIE